MPEQVASETQVATESSAEQGAQKTEAPQTFIGADGKFTQGWKEQYIPEEMRADKVFDTFDDVAGSLKMLGSLQNMIGKKGVIVPGEASPETEWDNFHREMGRPDTKDQFQMKVADDLTEIYDENLIAEARDMFFELGFDQKKVDRLWEFEEKRIRAGMETIAKAEAKATLDMENFYKEEYKDDWPIMQQRANKLIADFTDNQEEQQVLCKVIGNDPIVGKFLGTISAKFQEHRIVTETEQASGMMPSQAKTEYQKIEATAGFLLPDEKGQLLKDTNRPEYDRLEKERDRLYHIVFPDKKPG
jgi:hypothetical protein